MRRLFLFLCLFLCAPQLAAARGTDRRQEQEASVVFWNLATCMVQRNPDQIRKLLITSNWQVGDRNLARSLAQRSLDEYPLRELPCGTFGELKFNPELFKGTLAGAMFVRDTKGGPLPDYGVVQSPVTASDLTSAKDDATQLQLGLRAFSYCVFLNKPDEVQALLMSRPFSQAEQKLFDSLATTFGGCLPAQEGTQISFSHIKLRSLLGEAAFYADSSLYGRSPTGKTQ